MDAVIRMLVMLARGIPGVIVGGIALVLILFALVRRDASVMLFAALFAIPATYVFGEWTGYLLIVRLMPLLMVGSAFFISRDEPIFAWILPVPVFGFLIYYVIMLVASGFVGV